MKKLIDLNLMDDFLFNRLVSDPECGNAFVRFMLRTIFGKEPGKTTVIPQKVEYGEDVDKHGIRMDVYLDEEDASIIDLEVDQTRDAVERLSLPRRARFYHSKIDVSLLDSGAKYIRLRDVCVIFIVNYDPFGLNRMVYTVRSHCQEEPDMPYEDGALSVFLYTKGTAGNPPDNLRQLLRYMEESSERNASSAELQEIHQMVMRVKKKTETGVAYMQLYEMVEREKRIAAREGLEMGIAEGRTQGMAEGRTQGKAEGKAEDVILLLEELGTVAEDLHKRIMNERDENKLKKMLKSAARAKSIEEFKTVQGIRS